MHPASTAEKGDVTFIYDGDCPLCATAARAFRIRQAVGHLQLIDARTGADHPLVADITAKGYDLDAGMVIAFNGRYYHGADALCIMALLGSESGWFNRTNAVLFRSPRVATILYPALRGVRNLLIRLKGVPKLQNLVNDEQPIFQPIFGDSWLALPPVMQLHYANRPYTHDRVRVEGVMDVRISLPMRWLAPIMKWSGLLVPITGVDIPTTVTFRSESDSRAFCFDRTFHFPGRPPIHFRSRMVPVGGNEVIEHMALGIGWRAAFHFTGDRVTISHRGYVWHVLGCTLPLPLHWLFGEGHAEEMATGPTSFQMQMTIRHPWFGEVYAYSGRFVVTKVQA